MRVGAVLSWNVVIDQKLHPCASFSLRQRNYDIGNRDLLAVKLVLEECRQWLKGTKLPFLVWTDHKNSENIPTAKRPSGPSSSSALTFPSPTNLGRVTSSPMPCHASFWRGRNPPHIPNPPSQLPTWDIKERVKSTTENQPSSSTCPPDRLFVPPALRPEVLLWVPASKLACYPGIQRTQDKLLQCFWWATLEEDTKEFVNTSSTCSWHKPSHQAPTDLHRLASDVV